MEPRQTRPQASFPHSGFVRLREVLEIIQAVIWTGRIADENPVSLCLVAEQESAKSEALLFFKDTPTLEYFSDITSQPLMSLKPDIETRRLRHIVLLDLVRLSHHQKSVGRRTFDNLAGFMSEGQATTADAGGFIKWQNMPKVGVLMALTPAYYLDQRTGWFKSGFITRFIRCWFDYTDGTIEKIHSSITDGVKLPSPHEQKLPSEGQEVSLEIDQARAIESLARSFAQQEGVYGFRYHKAMRALAKALALIDGQHVVSDTHIRKLTSWQRFFTAKQAVTL